MSLIWDGRIARMGGTIVEEDSRVLIDTKDVRTAAFEAAGRIVLALLRKPYESSIWAT